MIPIHDPNWISLFEITVEMSDRRSPGCVPVRELFFLLWFEHKQCDHRGNKDQCAYQLRYAHFSSQDRSQVISPEAFYEQAGSAVKNQKPYEDLAFELLFGMKNHENHKDGDATQRRV